METAARLMYLLMVGMYDVYIVLAMKTSITL